MNLQERGLFWQTLCSLKGENLQGDVQQLIGKIKTPKYLYRYRSVSMNTLEALRTNKLYFSVVNPQGILLIGRSEHFSEEQQKDFELIKRQYKHVADIMTYDDLLFRLRNIIESLKIKINTKIK